MHGVQPSGRPWSLSLGIVSSASVSTVEFDWATQVNSAWTNGTFGLETLFPTATTIGLLRTYVLSKIGARRGGNE